MINISLYNGVKDNVGTTITIQQAIQTITGPSLKPFNLHKVYSNYLAATTDADKKEIKALYDAAKNQLPAVTWSGAFTKRSAKMLIEHSGIICIDIDGLTDKIQFDAIRAKIAADKYTYVLFTSPSGCGLKILLKAFISPISHKDVFASIESYYLTTFNIAIDKSGKDVSRLCFLCYDAELVQNASSEIYTIQLEQPAADVKKIKLTTQQKNDFTSQPTEDLYSVIHFTDKVTTYQPGNHNSYIYLFACNANRKGFALTEVLSFGLAHFSNYASKDVENIINNAYRENTAEHAKFKKDAPTKKTKATSTIANNATTITSKKDTTDSKTFTKFWIEREVTKGRGADKYTYTSYEIRYTAMGDFLYEQGYHLRETNADGWQLCHQSNGVLKTATASDVAQFVIQFAKKYCSKEVEEMVRKNQTRIFTENELRAIDYNNVEVKRDTDLESYFYFDNCWVSVKAPLTETDKEVNIHQYTDLKEHIWASNKNKKSFTYSPSILTDSKGMFDVDSFTCEFAKFVYYASYNPNDVDEQHFTTLDKLDRFESFMCAIGHILDGHKHPSNRKAIFALDHKIGDKNEKNGRSGKSIIPMACSFLKKVCTINGKTFDPRYPFRYEVITADAQILNFNDMKQSFDVEEIFEVIADDYSVLRRNNGYLFFPYETSPKVWYSANGVPKGEGGSYRARMHMLEFSDFFNPEHTPYDFFGHGLFSSVWNDNGEWDRFFSFMLDCVAAYKSKGLVPYPHSNLDARRLALSSNAEFLEIMEDIPLDVRFDKKPHYESYKKLLKENESKANSSAAFFKKSIELYCKAKGLYFVHTKIIDGKQKEDKSNGITYYKICTTEPAKQTTLNL